MSRQAIETRRKGQATPVYVWHLDPGHGWLAVPVNEALESGVDISAYSYYDRESGIVYLEEDCDAPAFLLAAGVAISQTEGSITYSDDDAPCRALPNWRGVR